MPKTDDFNETLLELIEAGEEAKAIALLKDHPRFIPEVPKGSYTPRFLATKKGLRELGKILAGDIYAQPYVVGADTQDAGIWFTSAGFELLLKIISDNDLDAFQISFFIGNFPYDKVVSAHKLTLTSHLASLGLLDMLKIVLGHNPDAVHSGSELREYNTTPLAAAEESGQTAVVEYLTGYLSTLIPKSSS